MLTDWDLYLKVPVLVPLTGYEMRMIQRLINSIDSSVKYTKRGADPELIETLRAKIGDRLEDLWREHCTSEDEAVRARIREERRIDAEAKAKAHANGNI